MDRAEEIILQTDLRLTAVYQSLFRFEELNQLPPAMLETIFLHMRLAYHLGQIHHYNNIVPFLNAHIEGLDLPLQDVD